MKKFLLFCSDIFVSVVFVASVMFLCEKAKSVLFVSHVGIVVSFIFAAIVLVGACVCYSAVKKYVDNNEK